MEWGKILEGLKKSRKVVEGYFYEIPLCSKPRELERLITDALNKKYDSIFKPYGMVDMGCEVYVHDDDDMMIEDVIYELTVYIAFDAKTSKDTLNIISKLIQKTFRDYPKFEFDRSSKQFYATADKEEDIEDLLDTLERDVSSKISRFYTFSYHNDVVDAKRRQAKEWEDDRRDLERYYNSTRL